MQFQKLIYQLNTSSVSIQQYYYYSNLHCSLLKNILRFPNQDENTKKFQNIIESMRENHEILSGSQGKVIKL